MFAPAEGLRLVDVPEGDVRELGRQVVGRNHHVLGLGHSEQRWADGCPAHIHMSGEHAWARRVEPLVLPDCTQGLAEGGHESLVLLLWRCVLL